MPPQPVTVTPTFTPEGLPNQFEDGASPPAAMSTVGGGDTWVACFAYSPDGATLAVGDRPTRPLCTFLGDAPVNQNGGLIRIVDLAARKAVRTIRPEKRPRYEYEIVSLAYTPDSRTLVAYGKGDWPGEKGRREVGYHVTNYDAATGRVLRRIDAVRLDDWELPAFSRDASTFATLTHAGVRVWDVATARQRPAPESGPARAGALALSPDGKLLAAGDKSGEFGIWDTATGRRIARFPAHRKGGSAYEVTLLTFSPDCRLLSCVSRRGVKVQEFRWEYDDEIRLIGVAARTERATIPGSRIEDVAFSPDGRTVATVSPDGPDDDARGLLTLRDVTTGKPRAVVHETRRASEVVYSADGARLVTADREWVVIRDPADGRERAALHQGRFSSMEETIALSPDGRTLASSNGRFQLWDLRAAATPPTSGGHRFVVSCLAYAPDGRTLASGSFDRTVKLWDLSERRPRASLVGHGAEVVRVAYAPDGRAVASVDAEGQVRVWDAINGVCRATLQGPDVPPWLLSFAPDVKSLCLISARYGRPVVVSRWDMSTGGRLPAPQLDADAPRPLAFSPEGALCVSAEDKDVRVWDAATGATHGEFAAKGRSLGLLVARGGETVFQLAQDESVVIYRHTGAKWDAADLFVSEAASITMGTVAAGERMSLSPDGRHLAVIVEGSVRVFDAATRRTIARLSALDEPPTWLAFAPDGESLAIGCADGGIFLFDLRGPPHGSRAPVRSQH